MKLIKTIDAAGHVLCHDMTEVVPGVSKQTRFRKGQIITAADIPVLLNMGKEQLYVWEPQPGMLHEEEAAEMLCGICRGMNIRAAPVREGKIELFAEIPGLLKINSKMIFAPNKIDGIAIITQRGNRGVKEGEKTAALKTIPLFTEEEKLKHAAGICGGEKPINIIPYRQKKAGLIITGNEIFLNRINDTGSEILRKKVEAFPAECAETVILPDDPEKITAQILAMVNKGIDLVIYRRYEC